MSKEFVRNIKNTKLRGQDKEPLYTNIQNDLLSDDEDVFVRNKDEYHALTDNIKSISAKSDLLTVNKTGKNTRQLVLADDKIALKSELAETNRRVSQGESDILKLIQVQEEIESILDEHGKTIEEIQENQEEIELSEEEQERLNDLITSLNSIFSDNDIDFSSGDSIDETLLNAVDEALKSVQTESNVTTITVPNQTIDTSYPSFSAFLNDSDIEVTIDPENENLYLTWRIDEPDYETLPNKITGYINGIAFNLYLDSIIDISIYYSVINEKRLLQHIDYMIDDISDVESMTLIIEE